MTRILLWSLNVFAWVTVIFLSFCSISLATSKAKTGIPKLFGSSIVQISSASMVSAGFNVGDFALVRTCDTESLEVGDYIVFYYYISPNAYTPSQVTTENIPADIKTASKNTKLILHEIKTIQTDANGHRWFITKGVNNQEPDGWIYDEYVVGKHQDISTTADSLLQFFMSATGKILIICFPVIIIATIDIYRILFTINEIRHAKKEKKEIKQNAKDKGQAQRTQQVKKPNPNTKRKTGI